MIFAVFDVLLAVNICINYSFFTFIYLISDYYCCVLPVNFHEVKLYNINNNYLCYSF